VGVIAFTMSVNAAGMSARARLADKVWGRSGSLLRIDERAADYIVWHLSKSLRPWCSYWGV
jgi:hypothetical protein